MRVATYIIDGAGRSQNAEDAEAQGLLPKTRLVAALRAKGIKGAAALVAALRPAEWHHTGLWARRTNYYDPRNLPEPERMAYMGDILIRERQEERDTFTARLIRQRDCSHRIPKRKYDDSDHARYARWVLQHLRDAGAPAVWSGSWDCMPRDFTDRFFLGGHRLPGPEVRRIAVTVAADMNTEWDACLRARIAEQREQEARRGEKAIRRRERAEYFRAQSLVATGAEIR